MKLVLDDILPVLVVLMFVLTVASGCGDDSNPPVVITDDTQNQTEQNQPSVNDLPGSPDNDETDDDDERDNQRDDDDDNTTTEPPEFGEWEFIYQSGDNQLSAIEVVDFDASPPQIAHRVVYEHPHEISSFEMLGDRSGIIVTTDDPVPNNYHTEAAYFVDADGDEVVELISPFETEHEGPIFRVDATVGGLTDRIWLGLTQSWTDASGNYVTSTIPMSLDDAADLDVHSSSCQSVSRMAPAPDGESLGVLEQRCGDGSSDNTFVSVYDTLDFDGRTIAAEHEDNDLDFRIAGSLEWLDESSLLIGLRSAKLVVLDSTGQQLPEVLREDTIWRFSLSPDRSLFAGVHSDGALLVTEMGEFDEWWEVDDHVVERAPSW